MGRGAERSSQTAVRGWVVEMKAGDFINIPAHQRHRVEWTTPDEPTIWLAVFYGEGVM